MIPERYAPVTYALFRIIFGYVFLLYGLQKMFGWFGGQQAQLMSLQGAAGAGRQPLLLQQRSGADAARR
jgi:uncharacterized membrane protein YphA (DoxX/SURF4 family)